MSRHPDSIAVPARGRAGAHVASQLMRGACGGGGGAGTAPPPTVSGIATGGLAAPTLTVSSVKRLDLRWPAQPAATAIRVLVDPDDAGPAPESPLPDLPGNATGHALEVFLPTARQAAYRIEVCVGPDCTRSAQARVGGPLAEGVGYLKAALPTPDAAMGTDLALSADGQTLAVGSRPGGPSPGAGEVAVYTRTGIGTWVLQTTVRAPNAEAGDRFGVVVALSANGQTLAVGATGEDGSASAHPTLADNNDLPGSGAVYVFERQGTDWALTAYLKSHTPETDRGFGYAVDLSADGATLLVASERKPLAGERVEVFAGTGASRVFDAALPLTGALSDESVSLSGDGLTVALGAYLDSSGGTGVYPAPLTDSTSPQSGAVHVWARGTTGWTFQAYLKSARPHEGAEFGSSVDLSHSGDTLAIGSAGDDGGPDGVPNEALHDRSGAAHVFQRSGGVWTQTDELKAPVADRFDQMGQVVALSGDGLTVALGVPYEDGAGHGVTADPNDNSETERGAVWLFRRVAGAWGTGQFIKPSQTGAMDLSSQFGWSVALSYPGTTLAVGARGQSDGASGVVTDPTRYSGGTWSSGAAYLY